MKHDVNEGKGKIREKHVQHVRNPRFHFIPSGLRLLATLVAASRLAQQVSRDADDDQVLAAALAARADLIVSGDRDLLDLGSFEWIRIVTTAEAVGLMAAG